MCVFVREPLWRLNPKKGGEVWNAGGVPKEDWKHIKGLTSAEDASKWDNNDPEPWKNNVTMIFNPSEKRINVVKTIINHPSVITYCKNYSEMGRLWHCFTHIIHPQHKLISQTDVHHMIRSKFEWKKTGLGKCHFFWTLQSPTESSSCDVQNPEKQYLRSS